jgi:carbonic anhydrase
MMISASRALRRLVEGNRRFCRSVRARRPTRESLGRVAAEQRPFAIVLGCSDSRTPVEIVFDQGFGDLFVVRVAGNIVAPSITGSIEFAASQFGARLVVVMGHARCGAVAAALASLTGSAGSTSRNIRSITDRIVPHIEAQAGGGETPAQVMDEAVRANVRASVSALRSGSRILEDLVVARRLTIVGAVLDLDSGQVRFLDGRDGRRGQPRSKSRSGVQRSRRRA